MMKIFDIDGEYTVDTIAELEVILRKRFDSEFNTYTLSHGNEEFPMLSMLVNGQCATLNFLERKDEPGFVPTGNSLCLMLDQNTVFRVSQNHADDVEIHNDAVVSFSTAVEVATEFFVSKKLPKCIEWIEL